MIACINRYPIDKVFAGMMLGKPVVSETGTVMLSEGTILEDYMLERLKNFGFAYLEILEFSEQSRPISPSQAFTQAFTAQHSQTVDLLYDAFTEVRQSKQVPTQKLHKLAEESLNLVIESAGVIARLALLDRKDRYTFIHSANVGITAGIIGKWFGLSGSNLKELVFAGFLHDIGKTQVPLEILNKPGKLSPSEMEIMHAHAKLGYQLILNAKDIPLETKLAILQHHEKLDGTGYPLRLTSTRISQLSQIISIADIYDALTSDRVYRKGITPFDAIKILSDEMFAGKIAPEIGGLFVSYLQEALVGLEVGLSNGKTGKIIYINRIPGSKPLIETPDGHILDMDADKKLNIVNLISI